MEIKILPTNFKYPDIPEEAFRFGSGELKGVVLRPDGDWRDFLPLEEDQNKFGVESSACYIYSQQAAIATLMEEQFKILDQDFSSRYNFILSDGKQDGGDPLIGGDSMRKDGLIPESILPFDKTIKSWNDFNSFKGSTEEVCRKLGKKFLEEWKLNYDIVFTLKDSREKKYVKLKEALKYSPVPMTVLGWVSDGNEYHKRAPFDETYDNHIVLCVYVDEKNRPYFWDSYAPYLKIGEPFYNSNFAMRWSVTRLNKLNTLTYCLDRLAVEHRGKSIFQSFRDFLFN